jgi:hypothetical protein
MLQISKNFKVMVWKNGMVLLDRCLVFDEMFIVSKESGHEENQ